MENLVKRTLTGVFIVVFVLGGFWLHPLTFVLTGLVLVLGSLWEYYRIIQSTSISPQATAGMITGAATYIISSLAAADFISEKWLLLLVPAVSLIMVMELYRKQEQPFTSIAQTLLPVIYTAVPFSFFPFSAFSHDGIDSLVQHSGTLFSPGIVIGFFILLWINDTFAYLVGVTTGRHRLMERISPKKSWEGFAGGLILSAAVSLFLPGWLGVTGRTGWVIISLIVSIAGTYGDLVESMLKRSTGIKDSGNIMPGHGGFLDRFDAVLISFPLVYLYLTLFG